MYKTFVGISLIIHKDRIYDQVSFTPVEGGLKLIDDNCDIWVLVDKNSYRGNDDFWTYKRLVVEPPKGLL